MKTILRYRDNREVVLRKRRGGCPMVDLEKEARKGLFSLVVQEEDGTPGAIAVLWANAKPRVARDPYLAGGETLRESARGSAWGSAQGSREPNSKQRPKEKNNEHRQA